MLVLFRVTSVVDRAVANSVDASPLVRGGSPGCDVDIMAEILAVPGDNCCVTDGPVEELPRGNCVDRPPVSIVLVVLERRNGGVGEIPTEMLLVGKAGGIDCSVESPPDTLLL